MWENGRLIRPPKAAMSNSAARAIATPRTPQVVTFDGSPFRLHQSYEPAGDQPEAIAKLTEGIRDGLSFQTLLGVTGSGKTYTVANVIAHIGAPAIVLAPCRAPLVPTKSDTRPPMVVKAGPSRPPAGEVLVNGVAIAVALDSANTKPASLWRIFRSSQNIKFWCQFGFRFHPHTA